MDRVQAIDSDLTSAKTDFSSLSEGVFNTNPLKKGETPDFAGIFAAQMQRRKQCTRSSLMDLKINDIKESLL